MKTLPLLLTLLTPLLLLGNLDSLPDRAPSDRSSTRTLTLDNGLQVVLISDPDLNVSSASMAVDVGSLKDPKDRQGLAHFLEHMLFQGTEKYPDQSEYKNYIRANGGYSNAYTAGDHTNYHFEVGHQAFEGALDRFAQFFIAPLFEDAFSRKEMNAVDSEFEQNLENDFRRIYQIMKKFYNPEHPANHFGTGNLETLEGVMREEFVAFYDRYYSANQMALALTGSASLDQLEAWTRTYFSSVPSTGRDPLGYPDDLILPEDALRLIRVKPVKDLRELQVVFGVDGTRDLWEGKSPQILGHILGFEGEGSLLSYFKAQGWATGLGSSFWDNTRDYSQIMLSIELTPEGQKQYPAVLETLFAYIDHLRNSPYPEHVFHEMATMARLNELYSDRGEGASRAVELANRALQYPLEHAVRIPYLYRAPDPESYFHLLEQMRPTRSLILLVSRDVETDKVEPIYSAEYGTERIRGPLLDAVQDPEPVAALTLPHPNRYVPESIQLLETRPVALIEEPGLRAYYLQDTTFERPRTAYIFRVRPPSDRVNLRNAVLMDFYLDVLREATNEELYTASVGGASAGFTGDLEGVRFTVSGYSGSAESLLQYLLGEVKAPDLPEMQFEALKEKRLREWRNFALSQAYLQAREVQRELGTNTHFGPEEKRSVAESITLEDVRSFGRELYASGNLEFVAHGNLTADEAVDAARMVQDALNMQSIEADDVFEYAYEAPSSGNEQVEIRELQVNNSSYWQEITLGRDTPRNRAAAMLINNFMAEPYFSEMRTRQQLGYVVSSFTTRRFQDLVAGFVIQSADYPAHELRGRSHEYLDQLPAMLRSLTDEDYARIVNGVRSKLEEKEKSIQERADTFFSRAFYHDQDWDRQQATLEALDTLSREALAEQLAAALTGEAHRSYTVLGYARQHEPRPTDGE